MSRFELAQTFEIGDVFSEDYGYGCERFTVATEPVIDKLGFEHNSVHYPQIKWKAIAHEGKREVDFLITDKFEHYGPKIYIQGDDK